MSKVYLNNNPTIAVQFVAQEETKAEHDIKELFSNQMKLVKAEKELTQEYEEQQQIKKLSKKDGKKAQIIKLERAGSITMGLTKKFSQMVVQQNEEDTYKTMLKRLESMVEDFNNKAAMNDTPKDEMVKLELQINIARALLMQQKEQLKQKEDSEASEQNGLLGLLKGKNRSKKMSKEIFEDQSYLLPPTFEVEETAEETNTADFDTQVTSDQPFEMQEDLRFRAQIMRDDHRRIFEIQECLDRSTVEDLISYKIREDRYKNLLVLDDLRWQQIKVAKELRGLQDAKVKYDLTVPKIAKHQYLQILEEEVNLGEMSAVIQNRTLDEKRQADENLKLRNYQKRVVLPRNAMRFRLQKYLESQLDVATKKDEWSVPKAINQTAEEVQPSDISKLLQPVKQPTSTSPEAASKFNNRAKQAIADAIRQKLRLYGYKPVEQPKKKEPEPKPRRSMADALRNAMVKKLSMIAEKSNIKLPLKEAKPSTAEVKRKEQAERLEKQAKTREVETQIEKQPRGFVRQAEFDNEMSQLVFNFGLKLYNLQIQNDLGEMIEPHLKLDVPSRFADDAFKEMLLPKKLAAAKSIWEQRDQLQVVQKVAFSKLDKRMEHTEFELMRKLYGDDESYALMSNAVKEADVIKAAKEKWDRIEIQNLIYAYERASQKVQPKPLKYEFNSKDFFPDGSYKFYSSIKKSLSKWLAMKGVKRPSVAPDPMAQKIDVQRSRNKSEMVAEIPNDNTLPNIKSYLNRFASPEVVLEKELPDFTVLDSSESFDEPPMTSTVDNTELRATSKTRIKKLDFVKLNKRIVLPTHHNWKSSNPSPLTSFDFDKGQLDHESDQRMPLSVRASGKRAIEFRHKILDATQQADRFLSPQARTERFLSPGQQNQNQSYLNQLQQLKQARQDLKQFNSIDEQLNIHLEKINNKGLDLFDTFDQFLWDQSHRTRIINKGKLGKMFHHGRSFKTELYVDNLPYARASKLKVVDSSQIVDGNQNRFIGQMVQPKTEKNDDALSFATQTFNDESTMSQQSKRPFKLKGVDRYKKFHSNLNTARPTQMFTQNDPQSKTYRDTMLFQDQSEGAFFNKDNNLKPIIQESEQEDSPREEQLMTEKELREVNAQLREEVQMSLLLFEQYLRVAMIQTEAIHFQEKNQDSVMEHTAGLQLNMPSEPSALSGKMKIYETFEVKENISDPTLAFTIAKIENSAFGSNTNIHQTPAKHKRECDAEHQHEHSREHHHGHSHEHHHGANTKQSVQVSTAKKPVKLSKELWDQITSVKVLNENRTPIDFGEAVASFTSEEEKSPLIKPKHANAEITHEPLLNVSKNLLGQSFSLDDIHEKGRPVHRHEISIIDLAEPQNEQINSQAVIGADNPREIKLFTNRLKKQLDRADLNEQSSIKHEQAQKLNFIIGSAFGSENSELTRLTQLPRRYMGMTGDESYARMIDRKRLVSPELLTYDTPFTRLEAKPLAVKDNLKNLIANPFLVGKKGEKPYVELDVQKPLVVYPLDRAMKLNLVDKDSRKAFKQLIKRSFKKAEFHSVHVEWIDRIRDLWRELESNPQYRTYKVVQTRVEENRKRLQQLQEENLFEYKVQQKRAKKVIKAHTKEKKKSQLVKPAEKKQLTIRLRQAEEHETDLIDRIREAKNQQADLMRVDLHDAVIKLKMDCRLYEHIIFQAQQLQLLPDARMERELELLKEKGEAILQDIFVYLDERDKFKWRGWEQESDPRILEIIRENFKLGLYGNEGDKEPTLEELDMLILKLLNEINFIDDKLDRAEIDKDIYEKINKIMKDLLTTALSHNSWIIWEHKAKRQKLRQERRSLELSKKEEPVIQIEPVELNRNDLIVKENGPPEIQNLTSDPSSARIEILQTDQLPREEENSIAVRSAFKNALLQATQRKQSAERKRHEKYAQFTETPVLSPEQSSPGSKWLSALRNEERKRNELASYSKRFAEQRLLEESSDDEDIQRMLDQNAAIRNLDNQLSGIKQYLRAENTLLAGWEKQDQQAEESLRVKKINDPVKGSQQNQ